MQFFCLFTSTVVHFVADTLRADTTTGREERYLKSIKSCVERPPTKKQLLKTYSITCSLRTLANPRSDEVQPSFSGRPYEVGTDQNHAKLKVFCQMTILLINAYTLDRNPATVRRRMIPIAVTVVYVLWVK